MREIFVASLDVDKELYLYPSQLAMMLEKLAHICELRGDRQGAEKHLYEAKLCRSGDAGEEVVRKAWREPCAEMYEQQINRELLRCDSDYKYANKLADKVIAVRESLENDGGSADNKLALAKILISKGNILYNDMLKRVSDGESAPPILRDWGYDLYDVPASRECFLRAHGILLELARERGSREDLVALAKSYTELETRVTDNLAEAEEYSLSNFRILKELFESSAEEEDMRKLADAYSGLASFYETMRKDYVKAAPLYEKSAQIKEELLRRFGNKKYGSDYRISCSIAKDAYVDANDFDGAERCRKKIETHLLLEVEELVKKTKDAATVEEWAGLVSAFFALGNDGDIEKKELYFKRAIEVSEEFERRIKIEKASFYVAQSYMHISDYYVEMQRLEDALSYEIRAAEKFDELMRLEPKKNYHLYKRTSFKKIAGIYNKLGDSKRSEEYLDMAKKIEES